MSTNGSKIPFKVTDGSGQSKPDIGNKNGQKSPSRGRSHRKKQSARDRSPAVERRSESSASGHLPDKNPVNSSADELQLKNVVGRSASNLSSCDLEGSWSSVPQDMSPSPPSASLTDITADDKITGKLYSASDKVPDDGGYGGSTEVRYFGPGWRSPGHVIVKSDLTLEDYEDNVLRLEYQVTNVKKENSNLLKRIRDLEADLFDKANDLDHYKSCEAKAEKYKKQVTQLEEEKFSLSEQVKSVQSQFDTIKELLKFKANLFEESELMNAAIKNELCQHKTSNTELQLMVKQLGVKLNEADEKLANSIELPDCVNRLRPWIDINTLINSFIASLTTISTQLGFSHLIGTAPVNVKSIGKGHRALRVPLSRVRRISVPSFSPSSFTDSLLASAGLPSLTDLDPRSPKVQAALKSHLQSAAASQLVLIDNHLKERLGFDGTKLINDHYPSYAKWIPGLSSWTTDDVNLARESSVRPDDAAVDVTTKLSSLPVGLID